jgi:hypothetical protein
VHRSNDRWRQFDAPTHGFDDLFKVGCGELDVRLPERSVHALTEKVVVLEQRFAQRRSELRGDFDEATVALPDLGVE